jgi:hypothetical protein
MATQIDRFEITSYGEIKVKVNKPNRDVEYQFYSVPKSIIVKFVSASKAPSLQDLEGWIQDYHNKKTKKLGEDTISFHGFNFWADND